MAFIYHPEKDPDYDHDDEFVEVRRSNLRHARNAHVSIGFGIGIVFTVAFAYTMLWVLNVI